MGPEIKYKNKNLKIRKDMKIKKKMRSKYTKAKSQWLALWKDCSDKTGRGKMEVTATQWADTRLTINEYHKHAYANPLKVLVEM